MTPQESQELYRDLQNQSEAAYADHAQIESRREAMRKRMQERLQQADTDNDNSVSRIEAEENMPGLAKHFNQIDTNHDGVITLDELKAADERRRELRELKKKNSESQSAELASGSKKNLGKTKTQKKSRNPRARKVQPSAETGS
jgi:hypothetical protein